MTAGVGVAMVLAAGRGERMRPLSTVVPKPALPMPDGPVVTSAIQVAAAAGVSRVVVNLHHLATRMAEAVAEIAIDGVEIHTSVEDELMGTAGGLALARDRHLLGDEGPVLVLNGDGILGFDLKALADRHHGSRDDVTLALLPHLDPRRWSRVVLDEGGLVASILPPGDPDAREVPFLYPGVMAIRRDVLDALPVAPGETPSALWDPARATGRLGGVVLAGHWREVGTPTDYLEVVTARLGGSSVVDQAAVVAASATISGALIGHGGVVGEDAVIEASVVGEGAVVGDGARVTDSVLLGGVEIGPGETISGAVRAVPSSG